MALQEFFGLFQLVFVVIFSAYLFYCVDYHIIFKNKLPPNKTNENVSLSDALLGCHECVQTFDTKIWCVMITASLFWLFRAVKVLYHLFLYYHVRAFYNVALKINDRVLDDYTWYEVQNEVCKVHLERVSSCTLKKDLTHLDIYYRILRFKNYLVAMIDKNLLPVKINIPVIGETKCLTHSLQWNIEFIFFWGPWSPFKDSCLKEDYKEKERRLDLAQMLAKSITYVAVLNLLLIPLISFCQILYLFFSYAEIVKREPRILSTRCWSLYGEIYLRHFNELDHELNARLNRAYKSASKYMNTFTDPLMAVVAQNVLFVGGSIAAVLIILSLFDGVINVIRILSLLIIVLTFLRGFIPYEYKVWCPEALLAQVRDKVHYIPDSWKGKAHTSKFRQKFTQLFQSKAIYLVSELLSPILTPLILLLCIKPKALDIVDFYRKFTVEVVGVGDVCSFAQMDVRPHANPISLNETPIKYMKVDSKAELSLVHFTKMNPDWKPPADVREFIEDIESKIKGPTPEETRCYGLGTKLSK